MNTLGGKIHIDFRSNEPIYLQIAQQIEQLISQGELKLGDQLPTVRQLATELRINFNTVSRAYNVLDEARLISTQRGRGTYIWEQPTEEHMRELREHHLRELARQYLEGAARLGFDRQQALTALEAINLAGAEPTNEGNAEEPRSNERQG